MRRRMWVRHHCSTVQTRPAPYQLVDLAGGQQLLPSELGGGAISLLFDIQQLSLRPCLLWGEDPPDAMCAVPPLVISYHSSGRVLRIYHCATGELLHSVLVELPSRLTPQGRPSASVNAADWLDAASMDNGLLDGAPPSRATTRGRC